MIPVWLTCELIWRRALLLIVVPVAIVSVACGHPPTRGIIGLSLEDGAVYAHSGYNENYQSITARSADGGFTWDRWRTPDGYSRPMMDQPSIRTPRGHFEIRPSGIARISDAGDAQIVHSTKYLQGDGPQWMQERDKQDRGVPSFGKMGFEISTNALGLLYDPESGNVIAPMGLQGVVVGTPEGAWKLIAVGPNRPTDFSYLGVISALTGIFLTTVATMVPVALVGLITIAGSSDPPDPGDRRARTRRDAATIISAPAFLLAIIGLGIFAQSPDYPISGTQTPILIALATITTILWLVALYLSAHVFRNRSPATLRAWIVALAAAALVMTVETLAMLIIWLKAGPGIAVLGIPVLIVITGIALLRYFSWLRRRS